MALPPRTRGIGELAAGLLLAFLLALFLAEPAASGAQLPPPTGSEALAAELRGLLEEIAREGGSEAGLEALADPGLRFDPLMPELPAREVATGIRLRRMAERTTPTEPERAGVQELAGELARWLAGFDAPPELELELVSLALEDRSATTLVRAELRGPAAGGAERMQRSARWRCVWRLPEGEGGPRLTELRLLGLEELRAGAGAPRFTDVAASAFDGEGAYARQLLPSLAHWQERLDSSLGVSFLGHQGLALGDVDGDGVEDLYLCQPGGMPNLLFLRRADAGAREAGAEAGIDFLDPTSCALLVDLDGDLDLDLAAALADEVVFLANDGSGRFERRGTFNAPTTMSLAAADVDGDGDLDVYLCGYVSPYSFASAPIPYHDANNGAPNRLLLNEGGLRLRNATAELGLDANNSRFSFAAAFEDYDDDGDQDLYVSNDFGRNNLYRNEGGRFADVAAAAGVEDVAAGMGVSWADFDGDGRMDLYVSNMRSPAGMRLTGMESFQQGAQGEVREHFRRHARGNALFRNRGDGRFEDVTLELGAEPGRWAWGAIFLDLDGDGRDDLFVPNGMATNEHAEDLESYFWSAVIARSPLGADGDPTAYLEAWHRINSLMRQGYSWSGNERNTALLQLDGRFVDASYVLGLDHADDGRAAARVDWDHDGRLDLLVTSRSGPRLRLLRNEAGASKDFVALRLVGRAPNTQAIGARVELLLEGEGERRVRSVRAGEGFLAQQSAWLHFGLSGRRPVAALVLWPSGERERFEGIERGRRFQLAQGSGEARPWEPPRASSKLRAGAPASAQEDGPRRIVPAAPIPIPTLLVEGASGEPGSLFGIQPRGQERNGSPMLLRLWSRGADLHELGALPIALAEHGIEVLELCVLQGEERALAAELFERMRGAGTRPLFATRAALDVLDVLYGALIDRETKLPLPSALLCDGAGRWVALYAGSASAEQVVADRALLDLRPGERRAAASAFPGRWIAPVSVAPLGYYEARFRRRGLEAAAREFMLGQLQVAAGRPGDSEILRARHHARSGRFEEAAAEFERATRLAPERFEAHSGLGITLHHLKRSEPAMQAYRAALRIDPDHPDTWYNLGLVALALGRRDEAVRAAEQLARLESKLLHMLERAIASH